MSEPKDIPGRHLPKRAEPIRPDLPGSGTHRKDPASASAPAKSSGPNTEPRTSDVKERGAAMDTVRKGYGGPSTSDDTADPSMVPNRPASDAQ